MGKLSEVLEREFENARQNGKEIKRSVVDEAKFLKISNPHLSRLRNEKVPLTRDVADKILDAFEIYTADKESLKLDLEEVLAGQSAASSQNLSGGIHKHSIKRAEDLFDDFMRSQRSVLYVDYRDWPQAGRDGAYPSLAEKAGRAVQNGLHFALFQPFGTSEDLFNMHDMFYQNIKKHIEKKEPKHPHAEMFANAYRYLYNLSLAVREVCQNIKKHSGDGGKRVVLYEAARTRPSLTAAGLQSRLFLADYFEGPKHERKIFDWVTAPGDEHYFIERNPDDTSVEAIRAQFHPISTFWESETRLPVGKELIELYAKGGMRQVLGNDEETTWKDWEVLK